MQCRRSNLAVKVRLLKGLNVNTDIRRVFTLSVVFSLMSAMPGQVDVPPR